MRVKVQFFARLRELAGRAEWDCEVPSGASVDAVWRAVTAAHPALEPFRRSVSCALNADFAPMSTEVHDGDEVAFLPPVSGGDGAAFRKAATDRRNTSLCRKRLRPR